MAERLQPFFDDMVCRLARFVSLWKYYASMVDCYVLYGSNVGNKSEIFDQAFCLINNRCGDVVALSSAYESEPWGFDADEWFLNRLMIVRTELSPDDIMDVLLDIESLLGRVRHPESKGYASRKIDLDILYYGDEIVNDDKVIAPHPRLHLRRFVLLPMCEVAPDFVHPVFHLTQTELLESCPDKSEVKLLL